MIVGGPIVPAPLLAELIKAGATVRYVRPPGDDQEGRYRPSTALDAWVRMRDLSAGYATAVRPTPCWMPNRETCRRVLVLGGFRPRQVSGQRR